jgi:hypothetical protein
MDVDVLNEIRLKEIEIRKKDMMIKELMNQINNQCHQS